MAKSIPTNLSVLTVAPRTVVILIFFQNKIHFTSLENKLFSVFLCYQLCLTANTVNGDAVLQQQSLVFEFSMLYVVSVYLRLFVFIITV